MPIKPLKILHIITSLEHGGAQLLASKVIIDSNELYQNSVFVLFDKGPYKEKIIKEGIEVIIPKTSNVFLILLSLFKWYSSNRPNIVQTWMYHSDFIGLILSLIYKNHKLIWSLHHADPSENKFLTKVIISICKIFSKRVPSKIIACSQLAKENHIKYGYSQKNITVINNGINFETFFNLSKTKEDYKFQNNKICIGHIARWHPIKGHKYFIEMASNLYKKNKNFSFTLVGTDIDWSNKELVQLIEDFDLTDAVQLLGEQDDINKVLNTLDIYVSSSINESFSLTLVEAIACRVLSISTDTGVARQALSDELCIVEVANSEKLTSTVKTLVSMPYESTLKIVDDSYRKINIKFDEKTMFKKYYDMYQSIS
jgi:glycosyltransferase involved in cell wall biosynthesis